MMSFIEKTWNWFTEPHQSVEKPDQRRKVRLLATLSLLAITLCIITALVKTFVHGTSEYEPVGAGIFITLDLMIAFLFCVVYFLCRSKFYKFASHLSVVISLLASFSALFILSTNHLYLSYLILGVIVSGLLLSQRGIALVSLTTIIGTLVVRFFLPEIEILDILILLVQVIMVSGLVLITSYIRQKDLDQIEIQSRQMVASESHFRNLIERSAEIIVILGEDGTIQFINSSIKTSLGFEPDEIINGNIFKILDPENSAALSSFLDPGINVEGEKFLEIRLQHKNSEWRYFEIRSSGRYSSVEFNGSMISCRNITDRKRSEKIREVTYKISHLANSTLSLEELYQSIHRLLGELISVENFFIALYDRARDMISFAYFVDQYDEAALEQKPGRGMTEYILRTGKSVHAPQPVFEQLIAEGEVELVGTDSVDWLGVPLKVDEAIIGVMVTQSYTEGIRFRQRDLELMEFVSSQVAMAIERKKAETTLQNAEKKYRQLVEQIPVVVYMDALDETSTTIYMSPLIKKITGYTPEEWVADPDLWGNLIHPDDRERILAENIRTNQTGDPFNVEYRMITRDQREIWIRDEATLILEDQGKPRFWQGVLMDITARKQAEMKERQRVNELETLYQTSLEINAQTGLDSLLNMIVERASSLVGVQSGCLYLIENDGETLTMEIGHGMLSPYIGNKIKIGEGLSGRVAQNGKMLAVEDYQNWEGRAKVYDGGSFRRTLAVPLTVKEKVIGVINVADTKDVGVFSDEEVRLVNLFADQAAISIENTRLFEQELTRTRELTMLYSSAMAISSSLNLDAVLKTVVEQVTQAIDVDGCTISLWEHEQDSVRTLADYRVKFLEELDPVGSSYALRDFPATRKVLETRQPLLQMVDDPNGDPAELALMKEQSKSTLILLPMVARDQVIGLMELYDEVRKVQPIEDAEIHLAQSLAAQTAIFIENARLFEDSQRRLRRTQALREIDLAIAGSMEIQPVLEVVLKHVIAELNIDAAVVLLYEPKDQTLNYALGSGLRTNALQFTHLQLGMSYAGRAAMQRKTLHISNLQTRTTDFLRSPTFSQEGFISYFAVPLIAKDEVKGVLEIFQRSALNPNKDWLDFMEMLAGQVAIAIDNATLYSDLQRSNFELTKAYDATIEGWSKALDLRDKETEGHTLRVTQMTMQLAASMGFNEGEIIHINRGALLHDIGKMSIPDSILLKPGSLTDDEWVVMRKHPVIAYEMLSAIAYLQPALDIPYCHHEKWNGKGYPRGLSGESIPLAARLFCIVDVWDALTSDRPYRPAWPQEKALEYIQAETGSHFDPKAVESFFKILKA